MNHIKNSLYSYNQNKNKNRLNPKVTVDKY